MPVVRQGWRSLGKSPLFVTCPTAGAEVRLDERFGLNASIKNNALSKSWLK